MEGLHGAVGIMEFESLFRILMMGLCCLFWRRVQREPEVYSDGFLGFAGLCGIAVWEGSGLHLYTQAPFPIKFSGSAVYLKP